MNGVEADLGDGDGVSVGQGPDRLYVHTPEGMVSGLVAKVGGKTLVSVDGRQFEVAPVPRNRGTAPGQESGTILAPMPGLVVDVFVEQDQWVESGAKILVLEAMKMQHVVTAGVAGTVSQVRVRKGQQVAEGDLLATVEESDRTGNGDENRGP